MKIQKGVTHIDPEDGATYRIVEGVAYYPDGYGGFHKSGFNADELELVKLHPEYSEGYEDE